MIKLAAALPAAALAAVALLGAAGASTAAVVDGHVKQAAPRPTVNSTIKQLLANEQTKAIMEKHLPGVSKHPDLAMFQDFTLAQVAPMSGGQVTAEIIAKIDADIKALPAG